MDARKGNIYEILNGNKQFLIPVYQRFYSWDIDQCKRLWNDIVEMQRKVKLVILLDLLLILLSRQCQQVFRSI